MASVGKQPPQPPAPPPSAGAEEPLPPLDPELGVLALEWAPDLAEMLRRYDDEWDRDMIEFAFSYWSGKIEKAKARQGDRIGCRMNGLLKAADDDKSIWEVATVLRTQSKSRNIYFLLLRFEDNKVLEEVVAKNGDLQQAEGGVWIGFNKSRRDSYIILDDWFKKKKEIKAVDPRVYRQWLDTREEIEPEPKPKSRNPSGAATPLSGASMVNHHPTITFDTFKMAEELGKQAARGDGDTETPASGRRKRNSVIEAEERMQLEAQHKELTRKLRQEMQKQKSEARKKRVGEKTVEGSSTPVLEATPAASPKPVATPEAASPASSPETPARRKRGRPPKSATPVKRKRSGTPPPTGEDVDGVKPEEAAEGSNLPGTPESSSTGSGAQPSTPGESDEDGRRHSRRRRGHMDAAEAYRLAACQGLVDANPYDKWAHDSAEAQQARKEQEEVEIEQIRLERRLKSEARSAAAKARHAAAKAAAEKEEEAPVGEADGDEEARKAQEREIEEKKRELREKQKEKARLKAELAAQAQRKEQERIVEQVLHMEQGGKGPAAAAAAADSRDAASGIIRIRVKPSPANSSVVPSPSETPKATAVAPDGIAQAAEEAAKAVDEPSPSEPPPTPCSVAMDDAEALESEASVDEEDDDGSDYEDDIVSVGRKSRGIKRSAAVAAEDAGSSKTKRRRGQQQQAAPGGGSKRRSSVSSPSRAPRTEEPKSPSGLFSPSGDITTAPHVNPRKLYREKATEGFRKLFEAGDVTEEAAATGEGSKSERCRRWATELESTLFVTTGGKNGESGWQKYLDAMKRLVPVIKDTQSREKHRHLQAPNADGATASQLSRPVGVTGLLTRGRLSVDQLASKHCTIDWLKELIGWDDMLLEDPTSDNRVKPIQGIRGILFKECIDPSKGPIHPGKRSAMQCHLWSYALEREMHASSSGDAASYRQAIAGLVRKLRELEANSLPAFRLLHTNKITCKDLASTAASAIIADNSAPSHHATHRVTLPSAGASSGGSTPGGGSPRPSGSPTEAPMPPPPPRTTTSTEPDLYDDLAVDSGVPRLPTKSDLTSASLKRVASALITAEEELQESAPDFAPAPMMDEESEDDDEDSLAEEDLEAGERSRDAGHSPPPVVSEGTWVAL